MEITDHDVEWAVVDRLASRLSAVIGQEFEQTLSFSFTSSIISWTLQRIRTPDNFPSGIPHNLEILKRCLQEKKFKDVFQFSLLDRRDSEYPLPSWTNEYHSSVNRRRLPDESALQDLEALRNAFCHSDARTVLPINSEAGALRQLEGFRLLLVHWRDKPYGEIKSLEWVRLRACDMRRLGMELAARFCRAMGGDEYILLAQQRGEEPHRAILKEAVSTPAGI
ncbi:MAG: hypothetical protein ACTHLC_18945 [Rhizobiaceae bacterium]|jgi:hypothetical protein